MIFGDVFNFFYFCNDYNVGGLSGIKSNLNSTSKNQL